MLGYPRIISAGITKHKQKGRKNTMTAILRWLIVGCFCLIDGKGKYVIVIDEESLSMS